MSKDREGARAADLDSHFANLSVAARGGHVVAVVSHVLRSCPESSGVGGVVGGYCPLPPPKAVGGGFPYFSRHPPVRLCVFPPFGNGRAPRLTSITYLF